MLSEPILWLPSKVWFQFLARRLEIIRGTQIQLHTKDPSNYGIMTGLLTHMLQSVLVTPINVSPYVNESLALLYYRQVVDRFGMFFLHNLDLNKEKCLPEVLEKDDLDVLRTLGVKLRKKKKQRLSTPDIDEDNHPLGRHPSWGHVEQSLKDNPLRLMRPWRWSDDLEVINKEAVDIFILFTTHIWLCLHRKWHNEGPVRPTCLKEALQCWSVRNVHSRLQSVTFVGCNAGLIGSIVGRRVKSFEKRRSLYFPDTTDGLAGTWEVFGRGTGYIKQYTDICDGKSADDIVQINEGLSKLLSLCECLPDSHRGENARGGRLRQTLWNIEKECVVMLTNPLYYKLLTIGRGKKRMGNRRAPTHTGPRMLEVALLEVAGYPRQVASRAINMSKAMNKRRSGKAKNRRQPPKKKPIQHVAEDDESELEDDQEELDELDGDQEELDELEGDQEELDELEGDQEELDKLEANQEEIDELEGDQEESDEWDDDQAKETDDSYDTSDCD